MTKIACIAAAAALCVAQGAAASPGRVNADALAVRDVDGILQQGRGGGKQEDGGSRGQGQGRGGSAQERGRGGSDDRPSAARQQGRGQGQSDRASGNRGQGGSQSGSARGNSGQSRRDDDRGSSSASENRGRGSSSASARGNSGRSDDGARGSSGSSRGNSGNAAAARDDRSAGAARAAEPRGRSRARLGDDDVRRHLNELPPNVRGFARSQRANERLTAGALARGRARGVDVNAFDVRTQNGIVRIHNRRGDLLLDLDDGRARTLGGWEMRRLGDRRPTGNAPAFCRSGEGHPVWGREWCLDKGFGLGSRSGTIWSRGGIDDVIWRRRTGDRLDRSGLIGVLGDVVFGRLALQAITLGYDQPLVGFWVAQPEGPRLLRVRSGEYEVAEFVDDDRDDRVDVLYVVQPVW